MIAGSVHLNVGGTEWVIIVFVALVLILGTGRLPGTARRLGRAAAEFKKVREEAEAQLRGGADAAGPGTNITGPVKDERQKFEVIARSLGIDPSGTDTDALKRMIGEKVAGDDGAGSGDSAAEGAASSEGAAPDQKDDSGNGGGKKGAGTASSSP